MAIESDSFARSEDLCTITVLGAMNPAIHHPAWYRFIGAIDGEEMAIALAMHTPETELGIIQIQANQGFSSAQFSVFTVGAIRITCLPNAWSITTTEKSKLERIIDVASKAFAALPHTPISGYTVGFAHHRITSLQDVGAQLARLVRALPLGIVQVDGAEESANLRYVSRFHGRDVVVDVQPSAKAKPMVFIAVNTAHKVDPVEPKKELALFDIGTLLADATEKAQCEAEEWVTKITTSLSKI
jgi:hypothetical protein